jgi:capsid assembly protease
MAHELLRLTSKIYNTPHLITQSAFENITNYIEKRNLGLADTGLAIADIRPRSIRELQYNSDTGVGILPVEGALSYVAHTGWCSGESASYQRILSDFKTMIEAGASVIVMDADSGGGEAYSCFQTANEMRRLADENNVKFITYVDGYAASAMYGLSAASHEIIVNPDSQVGSVGVVVSLANYSEAEKQYGLKRTYITAGESKVPYNEDGEFTKEFLADIQNKVDSLYEKFTAHVADYRAITTESVKKLGARMYTAEDALTNGLADKMMTREEFFSYLADLTEEGSSENMSLSPFSKKPKATQLSKEAEMPQDNVELQAALQAATAEFTAKLDTEKAAFATSLASLKADLEAAQASLAAVEKEKADAKQASRLSELTALFGTEEAPKLAASFAALDDAAFSLTVGILASRAVKEEEKLQTETGADGVVVVDKPVSYAQAAIAAVQQLNSKKQGK